MLSTDLKLLKTGADEAIGSMENAGRTLKQISVALEGLVKDASAMEKAQLPLAMQLSEGEPGGNVVRFNRAGAKS